MNRQLTDLARLYGIQTSYIDMAKRKRQADPESLLLVLSAMGAVVERFDDASRALARRKEELRQRTVPPVMVAWDGLLEGRRFEFGYHEIEIKGHKTFIISAPKKAYQTVGAVSDRPRSTSLQHRGRSETAPTGEKIWGAFVPIYALHSRRSPNVGDLTDFENVMDLIGSLGGTVMATLPLLGAFLDKPFEPSPYSPASRLFWNEFYIDVTRAPEFQMNDAAKRLAEKRPPRGEFVNYREEMAYKRRIVEKLAATFFADAKPERLQAFGKFVREHAGVEDYARFRAVTDRKQAGWNAWPARLRDGAISDNDYDEGAKNYHLYAQWIIQEQLHTLAQKAAAAGQLLYLDLPLGLHRDSYDIWRHREFFVRGVAGGAPPDPVFTKGQNWGFPPMHPEAARLNHYQYTIAYIRNHLRYARLLRIDHVMGLHRLYWIPDGLTGDKGVYVEYPADELYAILSLESHRYQAGIVGENLGTVPPAVNASMERHNIHQMYVVQYEIAGDPEKPKLRKPPRNSVASMNTHDMAPFRAFLDGLDIDDRVDLGLLDKKSGAAERKQRARAVAAVYDRRQSRVQRPSAVIDRRYRKALKFLSNSMANIVLINLEDLWEEVLPQNVPATNTERPNWRRRIRPSVERLRRIQSVVEVLADVFANRSRPLPL